MSCQPDACSFLFIVGCATFSIRASADWVFFSSTPAREADCACVAAVAKRSTYWRVAGRMRGVTFSRPGMKPQPLRAGSCTRYRCCIGWKVNCGSKHVDCGGAWRGELQKAE